jgi:hypothetical protein
VTLGPTGDIVDDYTTLPWEALCTEVARLRLNLLDGKVLEFRAVASVACDSPCDSDSPKTKKLSSNVDLRALSAARSMGLEPMTSGVTGRRSNQLN